MGGNRLVHRQAFQAGGTVKAVAAVGVAQDIPGIIGHGDRAAVAEHDDIGAKGAGGGGHGAGFIGGEDIGGGQEVKGKGGGDHVNLQPVTHPGFLKALAHDAIEQADGGEIQHA